MSNRARSLTALALASSLALVACKAKHAEGPDRVSRAAAASPAAPTDQPAGKPADPTASPRAVPALGQPLADHRKVIRTGKVDLTVADYDVARAKLDALVAAAGGYVDTTEVSRDRIVHATIVVRVPAEAFGALVPQLRDLGTLTSEHSDASDVTDQYVDLGARLASARILEKRLLELAAERTGTMDSLLTVERELAQVRAEIEGLQGRLRQWDDQIALSTLTLTMSTTVPYVAAAVPVEPTLGARASHTFADSITALREFASGLLIIAIALLPWLVIALPGFVLGRRLWRRRAALPVAIARPTEASPPGAA